MKRKAIRLLIWVLALICLVPVAAMARTFVVRWQAKNFLQDVMHIRVGESDLRRIAEASQQISQLRCPGQPRL